MNAIPSITSASPSGTTVGIPTPQAVTLTGAGFASGCTVHVNGAPRATTFFSPTSVQFNLVASDVASAGTLSVLVSNPGPGGGAGGALQFSVVNPVPVLTSLNVASIVAGSLTGPLLVTANGAAFVAGVVVRVDGIPRTTTLFSVNTVVFSLQPSDAAFGRTLTIDVQNQAPGGGLSGALSIVVQNPVPTATNLAPSSAATGSSSPVVVQVSGTQFNPSTFVEVDGVPRATSAITSTSCEFVMNPADLVVAGPRAVRVVNPAPAGGASAALTFDVLNPIPSIATVAPATVVATANQVVVTLTGAGFFPSTGLTIGGLPATVTSSSASTMTAIVPAPVAAAAGSYPVVATNGAPGGGVSPPAFFNVEWPSPVVGASFPTSAIAGSSAIQILIGGSGFSPATVAKIVLPITATLATSFIGAGSVSATLPASLLLDGVVYTITVETPAPGGGTSPTTTTFVVTNPVPAPTHTTPSNIPAGSPTTPLTIHGSGFTPSSSVVFDGVALATTFVNGQSLQVSVPANLLETFGPRQPQVVNPGVGAPPTSGGTGTTVSPLQVEQPRINFITGSFFVPKPTTDPPTIMTINGFSFLPTTLAFGDGRAIPTTFLSSNQLQIAVDGSFPQRGEPGGMAIAVQNGPKAPSNAQPMNVGGYFNIGNLLSHPLAPAPGEPMTFVIEGVPPGEVFTLLIDFAPLPPIAPFPDGTVNQVLSAFGGFPFALIDGLGVFGPPSGVAFGPYLDGSFPFGGFEIPGLSKPNPPLGMPVKLQAVYSDPTSPISVRLTWPIAVTL